MRVLGVDPGTAICGFGVVEWSQGKLSPMEFGAIRTSSDEPMEQRLLQIHKSILALIERHRPEVMAVEKLFMGRNTTTGIPVGQARGAVLLAAAMRSVPVAEYAPHEVKQAVTGYGRADKPQIQAMVKALLALGQAPRPDDAADALAVAICCAHSWTLASQVNRRLAGGALP